MIKNVNRKGFTLVELIVVMAIMGIVLSIIVQIFSFQTKMYDTEIKTNDAQNSGMLCLNSISESIRLASGATPNDPSAALVSISGLAGSSKQIVQITPYVGTSAYQYVINNNKLYKYVNSATYYLIASNVNKVTVTLSGSVYTIYVEITNGSSIKIFTTSVSIRNRGL
ncbi:MAG TPA: type II secretion system protein [Clostridium sp.]